MDLLGASGGYFSEAFCWALCKGLLFKQGEWATEAWDRHLGVTWDEDAENTPILIQQGSSNTISDFWT